MKEYLNKVYKKSKYEYFSYLKKLITKGEKKFIITANPEIFMLIEKDNVIKDMFNDENVSIVPDGVSIIKACKMLDINVKERIAGIDIAVKLLEYSNELKLSLYLFGAKKEVLNELEKVIKIKYPNINLLGTTDGYVKDKDKVMKEISKKNPDVVLVALGVPAQEKLIYDNLNLFKKGIFVGVGGSFDVISGTKKRAPKIFIKLNLEWLYRIIKEPKRIKRFYNSNIKFILKIKKSK